MATEPESPSPSLDDTAGSVNIRPVACLRCRQRRSYCSKDRPLCTRCREGGYECTYEEARKITVSESYLRALETKVKSYEDAGREPSPGSGRARHPGVEDDEDIEDEHPLLEPFTQLSVDLHGRTSTTFKGQGSSDNFLRSIRKLSGLQEDNSSLDLNPNFYDPDALPCRRQRFRRHIRLPPIDIARRLFAAQYTYIGTIFFFTDPETFEALLQDAYQGPPDAADKEACLAFAKMLMILAFGQLYSINQWIGFKGPPGFDYFTHALELLPEAHEEGSILCVETLAYVGYFMQNMNRRDAAFLYIGMALRMAISLGLHQEVSLPGLDDTTKEHRRRVWWSIYSLDRILCVKSGNPITILDEDIAIPMPSKLPTEPEYCPAVVLRHYTELSRILGDVMSLIYRKTPKTGSRLMASVKSIILSLSKWHANLPAELRFDPAKLSISRESVSTFLHYYQCINMTARPLLFHVVQKRLKAADKQQDWKTDLSGTTVKVIEMCVSAAQDTIHMMTVAAQRDLVATYGYMDGEHAFSAAIVLVLVCGAFPSSPKTTAAMNAGLELLKEMSQRGNSHMGARLELLVHLRSVIMPGTASGSIFSPSASITNSLGLPLAANTGLQGSMMLGPIPNLVDSAGLVTLQGDTAFSLADNATLGDMFYDVNMSTASGDDDFGLWEEGFSNPAGYDLSQWTQAAQMAVDQGL